MTAHVISPSTPVSDDSPIPETRRKRTSRKTSPSKTSKFTRSLNESNSNCDYDRDSDSSSKKRKKQVKQACAGCKKAHTRCEDIRPCPRCKSMKVECIDAPRKKRKRRDAFADIPNRLNLDQTVSGTYRNELESETSITTKKRKCAKGKVGKKQRDHEEEDVNTATSIDVDEQCDSEDQEAEISSSSSSPRFSSEDCDESDDLGVYTYHQHHHLLYHEHITASAAIQTNNSSNLNWERYYDNRGVRCGSYNLRNTTLSALFYGIVGPGSDHCNSYNHNSVVGNTCHTNAYGSGGSIGNEGNNYQRVMYGNLSVGGESRNVYYQPEDLQRIRENYLKDWLC